MKALLFVVVGALLTTTCAAPAETQNNAPPPAKPRRPNIVMVLVDDMRWDEMRVAGHPFVDHAEHGTDAVRRSRAAVKPAS